MIKDCGFTSAKKILSFHKSKKYYQFFESSCALLCPDNSRESPIHIHSQDYESDLSNTLLHREDYLYCLFYPLTTP